MLSGVASPEVLAIPELSDFVSSLEALSPEFESEDCETGGVGGGDSGRLNTLPSSECVFVELLEWTAGVVKAGLGVLDPAFSGVTDILPLWP